MNVVSEGQRSIGIGIGMGDLQLAAEQEVREILKKAKGNRAKAVQMVIEKLSDMELITEDERDTLKKMYASGFKCGAGKREAEAAYVEARTTFSTMLADGHCSPVALALASAEANSYERVEDCDGEPRVVYRKSSGNWQGTLAAAGATIGAALGGPAGAALGSAIGGVAGKIVDQCQEE